MNVLILGSGGREHALAWKISQSPEVRALYCAPGNPGIASLARTVPLNISDQESILKFAQSEKIDLTIVGPEQSLANGVVDLFEHHRMPIFGPTKNAAELEWSKVFAKEFMERWSIPTAAHRVFSDDEFENARRYLDQAPMPVVLKVDGLAAGKGVLVCRTANEALTGLEDIMQKGRFGTAGSRLVVEEFMRGEEASVFAICDGEEYVTLVPAQDYKRALDGDQGKNTGGMGAHAPASVLTNEMFDAVRKRIIEPTLHGMEHESKPYRGCLYVGLMITGEGPKVVEFNSRFGDPETQVVLPLFDQDLFALLHSASTGTLSAWKRNNPSANSSGAAVCVILASGGYPDSYAAGKEILGVDELARSRDVMVFHAGTMRKGDVLQTAGGRVLGVTAWTRDGSIEIATRRAYETVRRISFEGMHFRSDIGKKALKGQVMA